MRTLEVVALVVSVLGAAVGMLRWLRVAEREHYLPGSCFVFAARWWRSSLPNGLALLVGFAGLVVGIFHPWISGVTGIVVIVGPFGLSVRGRTAKLVWTKRLARVAVLSAVAVAAAVTLAATIGNLVAATEAAAVFALASPLVVDVALDLLAPIEDRLAMGFVRQAEQVLQRTSPVVVGITGSYGKTSTKGYVAHLLAGRFTVLASPRSYNNRAGLARTVNEHLVAGTDVLVAEMGSYGPGEIAAICRWLPPKIAVMTAIGPVHLERFGSLEVTVTAKSEITETADTVVLNVDDERLAALVRSLEAAGKTVIGCSATDRDADVVLVEVDGELGWFRRGERVATLDPAAPGLGGARTNVAAAIGVAEALGCPDAEIIPRLGDLPVAENRLARSVAASGAVILDDTFNSNPAGTRLVLDVLAEAPGGRRVVVTPGMVELGPLQRAENERFAELAAAVADDLVVVARTNRRALVAGARRADPEVRVRVARTRDNAVAWVRAELDESAVVLYENDLPDHFP